MLHRVYHAQGYTCYACSIDVAGKYRNESKMISAFRQYEDAVEYIEGLPPGTIFNRVSVWTALGRGYQLNRLVYSAIRDMYAHGLLECVHVSNHRCLKYRVRSDLDIRTKARQDLSNQTDPQGTH